MSTEIVIALLFTCLTSELLLKEEVSGVSLADLVLPRTASEIRLKCERAREGEM